MNIGIDIDDTIANTSQMVDVYAKEYTENSLKREFKLNEIEILAPMWARHLYGWTIEEDEKFWDKYYENIMESLKPKDNAIEIINELSKENNINIFIDDNYKTCRAIHEIGIRTLLMNSRLNENMEIGEIERVFNWKEIEEKIKCPTGKCPQLR